MTDTTPRTFTPLTEHPLPLNEDEVAALAEDHPQLNPDIHVDTLHEDYITVLAKNREWRVFTIDLSGYSGHVYLWNPELGEGLAVQTAEWSDGNLAEAFALYRQAVGENVSDDALPVTPDDDAECPFCGGALSSSTMPSGATDQYCPNCSEHRSVG